MSVHVCEIPWVCVSQRILCYHSTPHLPFSNSLKNIWWIFLICLFGAQHLFLILCHWEMLQHHLSQKEYVFPQISGYLFVLLPQLSYGFNKRYDFVDSQAFSFCWGRSNVLSNFVHLSQKPNSFQPYIYVQGKLKSSPCGVECLCLIVISVFSYFLYLAIVFTTTLTLIQI